MRSSPPPASSSSERGRIAAAASPDPDDGAPRALRVRRARRSTKPCRVHEMEWPITSWPITLRSSGPRARDARPSAADRSVGQADMRSPDDKHTPASLTVFPRLTLREACDALATVGVRVAPAQIQLEKREERWLARLPDRRIAWFAASTDGQRRLQTERRVLRLLEARCSFAAPRVLVEASGAAFDVRAGVPATADPWYVYDQIRINPRLGSRIGAPARRDLGGAAYPPRRQRCRGLVANAPGVARGARMGQGATAVRC